MRIIVGKRLVNAFREALLCDSAFRVIFIFQVAAAVLVGNCCDVAVFTLLKKRMYQIICESLHSLFYTPAQTHSLYSCTVIQKSETDFQYLLFTKFNIFVFLLFFLTICQYLLQFIIFKIIIIYNVYNIKNTFRIPIIVLYNFQILW